jgi:Tol biopolymer transport system component
MAASLGRDEITAQLERMLASGVFRGAARSSTLLRFLVEQTLAGHAERLKDYTLGAEALGRGDSFDPRTDPIARVEAGRLRQRLELYYATEGAPDPVVIALPKGGYVPTFERPSTAAPAVEPVLVQPARRRWPGWVAVVAVAALGGVAVAVLWPTPAAPAAPEMRLEISTPATTDPVSFALSPDGQQIVFVAGDNGTPRLWLRPLSSTTARPLPGTDHPELPFWHPDGRSVGFFAAGEVKRIELEGGLVEQISRAAVPAGAAWSPDGTVVHPLVPDSPLFRAQPPRLIPAQLTSLDARQTGHRGPRFLPDGVHFLFYVMGPPGVRGIHVGSVTGGVPQRLAEADSPAVFARDHLFYLRQGTLFAQPFDAVRLTTAGDPQPVAEGVASSPGAGIAALSASSEGTIAFRTGPPGAKRQFVWFDRAGRELSRIGGAEHVGPSYGSLSPDARRLAVQRTRDGNTDVWLLDLERGGTPLRFTTAPEADIAPLWSPQGDSIVFSSLVNFAGENAPRAFRLFRQPLTGGPAEVLIRESPATQATDWSKDGRFILYRTVEAGQGDNDIWALEVGRDRQPFPVVKTPFMERDAQFSPDGKWIAYQSNESGRFEIYVQRFNAAGERERISPNGGAQVRWRADGRELFYLTLDNQLTAVPVSLSERDVRTGPATALFRAPVGAPQGIALHNYIVSQDGQRFLLDTIVEEPAPPIVVILNWKPGASLAPR